jgi:hypothetical protein
LKLRAAQIQITVFEAQVFARKLVWRGRLDLERRRLRIVEDEQLARAHFYVAGRDFRVALVLSAQDNFALDGDDVLAAHLFGFRVCLARSLFVEHDLRDAVAVAQINERQRPEVAPPRDPAHQGHAPPDIFRA